MRDKYINHLVSPFCNPEENFLPNFCRQLRPLPFLPPLSLFFHLFFLPLWSLFPLFTGGSLPRETLPSLVARCFSIGRVIPDHHPSFSFFPLNSLIFFPSHSFFRY
ncbi:hypothetical protein ES332_D12G033800v1 [Gossypium tomentosum]|uniref:Uncharacterized protein n=1 Tax=Gossypium tomentosum TaxID=34277 RepID=A0A5D2I521_GOSTO|nr:hypothetical protein ES332_D12G033800v1 [Gossypium tomentosum]